MQLRGGLRLKPGLRLRLRLRKIKRLVHAGTMINLPCAIRAVLGLVGRVQTRIRVVRGGVVAVAEAHDGQVQVSSTRHGLRIKGRMITAQGYGYG